MPFLIPILIAAGLGMVAGGVSSYQRSRANRTQAEAAQQHAQSLEQMLESFFQTDTTSPMINEASRAIGGQFASSGLAGSGMNQAAAGEAAASIMAQDTARRQQLEAQVRGDPSFRAPDPSNFRPGWDAFLGGLGGAAGGAGQAMGNTLSTEPGWNAWTEHFAGSGQDMGRASVSDFSVQAPPYDFRPKGQQRMPVSDFGVRGW